MLSVSSDSFLPDLVNKKSRRQEAVYLIAEKGNGQKKEKKKEKMTRNKRRPFHFVMHSAIGI